MTRQASLRTLWIEDLKGLLRARFAWTGAALLFGLLALLTLTLGLGTRGLQGLLLVSCAIVPCLFAPLVAADVAGVRSTLLAHRVFTAPVSRGRFLLGRALAHLSLALLYLVALAPVLLVYVLHAPGTADLVADQLLLGAGLLAASVVVGLLCGVAMPAGGPGAAAGVAGAFAVLSLLATFLQGVLLATGAPDLLLRALHASPHVALFNAAGETLGGPDPSPDARLRAGVAFAVFLFGAALLAAWIHQRAQGVDGWHGQGRGRAVAAVALLLLVLSPLAIASAEFEEPARARPANEGPRVVATLARPGEKVAANDHEWLGPGSDVPLGRRVQRELVILLPEADARDVKVRALGGDLQLTLPRFGVDARGREARIPVGVQADGAAGLHDEYASRRIEVTYTTATGTHRATATVGALASAEGAAWQLGVAAVTPVLACALLAVRRARRSG